MSKLSVVIWITVALTSSLCSGGEVEEVAKLATKYGGVAEYRLWDSTRVDLLTDTHAIEADWSYHWAEAIGQSLYYAQVTGRKPGIILLVKDVKEEARFIYRCQTVCTRVGIDLFIENIVDVNTK